MFYSKPYKLKVPFKRPVPGKQKSIQIIFLTAGHCHTAFSQSGCRLKDHNNRLLKPLKINLLKFRSQIIILPFIGVSKDF